MKRLSQKLLTTSAAFLAVLFSHQASAGWGEDTLRKEADYIVDCSWTGSAQNGGNAYSFTHAYGALNNVRISSIGPDWVVPREAAIGMIGLMAAAKRLDYAGENIQVYKNTVNRFFDTWVVARKQPIEQSGVNAGGFYGRVYYSSGGWRTGTDTPTAAATGSMVIAMWKRYEYLLAVSGSTAANNWLNNNNAWDIVEDACNFINARYNSTHQLVASNAGNPDLWITDSVMSACALKCAHQWASLTGRSTSFNYDSRANSIKNGVSNMRDTGGWKNFYRVRQASEGYAARYGDAVDQLCFLPFESGLIPMSDGFADDISNWWTNGGSGLKMTKETSNSSSWKYYGIHWHYYFAGSPENEFLYPGPTLQLGKVEWKISKSNSYSSSVRNTMKDRADRRYAFANSTSKSNLWFGANGYSEASVPNGLVDWRDSNNYNNKAGDWERFVDTSSYMIQMTLMIIFNEDTTYLP